MKVTRIKPQKKDDRFNIYIDGKYTLGVSSEVLLVEKLAVGKELDDSDINRIVAAEEKEKLYQKSINYLSYRPRSEYEVRTYLYRKVRLTKNLSAIPKAEAKKMIEVTLTRLKENKYLNDEDFTVWWIEQRRKGNSAKGAKVIEQELSAKGLDSELVNRLIRESVDQNQEYELAEKLINKKFSLKTRSPRSPKKEMTEKIKQKMYQFLVRRGFAWEVAKSVVDDFIESS